MTSPYSVEAEQAVLGGLMLDNMGWDKVADVITEEDFYRRDHRLIFSAISHLANAGQPCDAVTLSEWLDKQNELDNVGGLSYLGSLANNTPTAANIKAYAEIVRERSTQRQLIQAANTIIAKVHNPKDQATSDLLADSIKAITDLASKAEVRNDNPIEYRRLSDIEAKPINWLWPDRIARGKVSMIAGNPGLGKSQITASLSAIVSTGSQWPVDRTSSQAGNVIILSAEDDAADTIRPRLEAAGADLTKIFILDAVRTYTEDGESVLCPFDLKTDLLALEGMIESIGGVAMIIIDPITSYLGSTDSHKNAEVRGLLAPLSDMAGRHEAAIVCVSHLNKSGNSEAMMRITGSLAFVAAARAAYLVAQDENRRVFLPMKNNVGNDTTGLAFTIEGVDLGGGIQTSRVAWREDIVSMSADEVLERSAGPEERSALDDAKEFLIDLLTDNPLPAKQVYNEADQAGHAKRTIQRAKDQLDIKSAKTRFDGQWEWHLPDAKIAEGSQDSRVETLAPLAPFDTNAPEKDEDRQDSQECRTGNAGDVGFTYQPPFVKPAGGES